MHIEWRLPPALIRPMFAAGLCAAAAAAALWWLSAPVAEETVAGPVLRPMRSAATVLVDVVGTVRHPGVVRLPAGARVVDAVTAAGGVIGNRQPVENMARAVIDGEQIVIGAAADAATSGIDAVAGGAAPAGVDLNSASVDELDALPGIGPVLAKRIIEYRSGHGRFVHKRDLLDVPGIGETIYSRLADAVNVA